jgi:hypothetical protein
VNARQTVAAPVRQPRRFGIFSVVDIVEGGDQHWMFGGLTADGEECSKPLGETIPCGPTPDKTARSWYSDIEGDPWLAYMFETCKTVGRYSEAAAKLRTRFLASEQSAVETEFQDNVLDNGISLGTFSTSGQAIAALEAEAAAEYGGQITLHMGAQAAADPYAFGTNGLLRVGDHLETISGNLVSIGNYHPDHVGGTSSMPIIYATGATTLYRSELVESGPVFTMHNDYYVLIERAYAAIVDCFAMFARGGEPT